MTGKEMMAGTITEERRWEGKNKERKASRADSAERVLGDKGTGRVRGRKPRSIFATNRKDSGEVTRFGTSTGGKGKEGGGKGVIRVGDRRHLSLETRKKLGGKEGLVCAQEDRRFILSLQWKKI